MLYERDYRILTVEEQARWAAAEKRLHDSSEKGVVSTTSLLRYWKCLPQAVPYYTSLFPNHLLGIDRLEDTARLEALRDRFAALLDGTACTERQVLEFIRTERAWPLVGAILHHGCSCGFGHHEAYLFREFPLGTNYVADYLLVGKGSGGYEFLFVELESPQGAVTTRDGGFGAAIRKGIAQAESWRRWLDAHFMLLQAEFEKHLGTHRPDLPREFQIGRAHV